MEKEKIKSEFKRKLFGTDGVRDLANSGNMTPEAALRLGRAFIKFNHAKKIVVGRDTRLSGKMLEAALISGMASEGADVYSIGIIPTPGVSHAVKKLNADGGAVISASHNPAEYNGIKFLGSDGCKLSDYEEFKIEKILDSDFSKIGKPVEPQNLGNIYDAPELVNFYAQRTAELFNFKNSDFKKNIVFDCAFGAVSVVIPELLKRTGIKGHVICSEFNGLNINDGAGVMNMENLTGYVVKNKSDIGFAFDGDADRVLVCDSKGRIIDGDIILWILAKWQKLRKLPGSDSVVVTVMSNMALESKLENENIKTIRCSVGDRYVLEEMRNSGSGLGGEQSGHIIASEFTGTGDGLCTAMLFLNAIKELNEEVDTLVERFGRYPQKLTNLKLKKPREDLNMKEIDEVVREYEKKNSEIIKNGRIFIRTSGTEPLLRILVEVKEAELVERITSELSRVLEGYI